MCGGEYYFLFVLISFAIYESGDCLLNLLYDILVGEGEYGGYVGDFG